MVNQFDGRIDQKPAGPNAVCSTSRVRCDLLQPGDNDVVMAAPEIRANVRCLMFCPVYSLSRQAHTFVELRRARTGPRIIAFVRARDCAVENIPEPSHSLSDDLCQQMGIIVGGTEAV